MRANACARMHAGAHPEGEPIVAWRGLHGRLHVKWVGAVSVVMRMVLLYATQMANVLRAW